MKAVAILGSTGSIGRQTLDIIKAHPDSLKVAALAAGANKLDELVEQIRTFKPELVSVPNSTIAGTLQSLVSSDEHRPQIAYGTEGLVDVATHSDAETVVTGVVGFLGLIPTAAAIRKGKTIALANKETLVAAGGIIMPMAREHKARIVPVDSEHSAIFQALAGSNTSDVRQILLTGSGGPFRTWSKEMMDKATIDDALKHPNWSMGPKITIDSATLMNKGLEIIEARWLFDMDPDKIRILIHPQSILHSAVEFIDGSVVGQMGLPDMRLPIHYALFFPQRVESHCVPRLDFIQLKSMTFEEPDYNRFPCLSIARQAAKEDSTLPCALNAANEIAVDAFLKGAIKFGEIPPLIESILEHHISISRPSIDEIIDTDRTTRSTSRQFVSALATRNAS